MLYWYFVALTDTELARLLIKTDHKFWYWVDQHYAKPTPETAYQVERWRRLNYMIYDEMYSLERYESKRKTREKSNGKALQNGHR